MFFDDFLDKYERVKNKIYIINIEPNNNNSLEDSLKRDIIYNIIINKIYINNINKLNV
jgi:hypothetical protein